MPGPILFEPYDVVDGQPRQRRELFATQARSATTAARGDAGIRGCQAVTPCVQQLPEGFRCLVHRFIIACTHLIPAGTRSPTVDPGTGCTPRALESSRSHRPVLFDRKGPPMTATHTLLMTGASRGIGRLAAADILAGDPDVHLVVVARGDSGPTLARELAQGKYSVSSVSADLRSITGVRTAAREVAAQLQRGLLPPLQGFVGNAGIQYTNAITETVDGFEATFAVNVIANHVFVRTLESHFRPGSRITITVSDTHFGDFAHNMGMVPGPAWRAPSTLAKTAAFANPTTTAAGRTAYSTSKLAAIYLVHEYARRLPAGIDVVSYNPGFVPGTSLARNAGPISRFMMSRIMPIMTLTPLATSQNDAGRYLADVVLGKTRATSGSYVDRARADRSSDESYDPGREARVWEAVEKITAVPAAER
jgi:NAD(P)-dependent dehydrogenase (short-subunit alcohol dehydrogenase family)